MAEVLMGMLERLGEEGKVLRKLRTEFGTNGFQGLQSLEKETVMGSGSETKSETGSLIELG